VIYFLLSQFGGGISPNGASGGSIPGLDRIGSGQQVSDSSISAECKTGADANKNHDCAIVAIVNSVQDYWGSQFSRSGQTYRKAQTNFFDGDVRTACGNATSDVGPFYCPGDSEVYIDLSFFNELTTRFGAQGGLFTEAYVLAHEYGHHVQNLLGTSDRVGTATGATSGSVRLELQADCYAGVWANHATTVPDASGQVLVTEVTNADLQNAVQTAATIGDDYIQTNIAGQQVDSSQFSHGTSAQRQHWLQTGYQSGNPASCNTFDTDSLG
jgi:predicted metalloprotease